VKTIYICSDSEQGIFSAIYDAWRTKLGEEMLGIALRGFVEQELFSEYVEVTEEEKKRVAVQALIRKHLGEHAHWNIYHALLSHDTQKGDAILGMMLEARRIPDSKRIMGHLTHPKVEKVFSLARKVANEAHYYQEFVRFEEREDGILFSKIAPQNRVLTCLAEHFTNRYPLEHWMIFDETHNQAIIHEKGKRWILVQDICEKLQGKSKLSFEETGYVNLWNTFFQSVSIKERESYKRQRGNLPLRFREHMTEFQ